MSTESAAKKPFYKKWWFWVVVVVVLAAVGKGGGGGGTTSAGTSSVPPVPLPPAEAQLIQIVSAAQSESHKAENDMQRGGIKAKRDRALCEAVTSFAVSGWIGTVEKIDSNSDGKGVLEIAIADDIKVKTWNNALSDISSNTLIEPGSPVFQAASAMKRGQRVAFSGSFLKGSEGDCLAEGSLSLRGKIEDPEFIFRFSSISTNLPTQPPVAQQNAAPATTTAPAAPASQQTAPTAPTPLDEKHPIPTTSPSTEKAQALPQVTWKPSFDCSKASTFSEKAICSDPLLGKLDGALSENYKSMLASNIGEGARSDLKTTQRKWLTERNKCTDNQCLANAHRKRIDEVCVYPVISGVHPVCTNSDEIK